MHYSIIVFPGSNCDRDCIDAAQVYSDNEAELVWYKETCLPQTDCVILPGGFSYGDYLRPGAIAKSAPIILEIIKFAQNGGLVLGICNGFQVLTEIGLLPGSLIRNESLRFICDDVFLRIENTNTPFTKQFSASQVVKMPVAHMDGNYFVRESDYQRLVENNQIVFRYANAEGEVLDAANPNGSVHNIAGVCNEKGNVLGLMPHPERNLDMLIGDGQGKLLFDSIEKSCQASMARI